MLESPGYGGCLLQRKKGIGTCGNHSGEEVQDSALPPFPPPVVLGAIDDHDYGCNNGDKTFPHRKESNELYVEFLRASNNNNDVAAPGDSSAPPAVNLDAMARRAEAGLGVYGAKVFDFGRRALNATAPVLLTDLEAGLEAELRGAGTAALSDRSVAVFLLDVRSNKDPWPTSSPSSPSKRWLDRYRPDYASDFLGEEQWRWLEASLRRSKARINLIVQGLQVHPDRYYDGNVVESWGRFPKSQHRLYQTVLKSGAANPVLLSGDVHMSELLLKECRQPKKHPRHHDSTSSDPRRYLLEVTASGMTHSWGGPSLCARPHSSAPCRSGVVAGSLHAGMTWAHASGAWTDLVDTRHPAVRSLLDPSSSSSADGKGDGEEEAPLPVPRLGLQFVLERNFCELEFDWDRGRMWVRFFGHGKDRRRGGASPAAAAAAALLSETAWKLDALGSDHRPSAGGERGGISPEAFDRAWSELGAHGALRGDDDWICLDYRGPPGLLLKLYGVATPVLLAGALLSVPVALPALLAYYVLLARRRRRQQQHHHQHCANGAKEGLGSIMESHRTEG
jgi:hypothetical protein